MTTHYPPAQTPPPPRHPPAVPQQGSGSGMLWAGLALLILAWPLLIVTMTCQGQLKRRPQLMSWLAVAGIGLFLLAAKPLKSHIQTSKDGIKAARSQKSFGLLANRIGGALPLIWLYTLPLGPAAAFGWREVRPKTLEEREQEKLKQAQEKHDRAVQRAARQGAKRALTDPALLGIKVEGESIHLFQEEPDDRVYVDTSSSVANLHMFLPGESGAGKTESLFRLMAAYAASTDWSIFYIDPKGETSIAERFYSLMRESGRSCAVFPNLIYNGWQGSTNALVDRIMALASFAEDGAAAYYTEAAEVIIRAAVLAGGKPPQSFEELEARLHYQTLLNAHADDPVTHARITSAGRQNAESAHMRIANMTAKLTRIRAGGWTMDTMQSAIWSVPVMGNKRDSAAISRFVLSDIEDYFSNRKDPAKRVVVVIDEFSSLGNDAVIRLMEVVRSLGGVIILAAQTVEGLGTPEQAARILGNVTTLCHRMSDASAIIHRAGTVRRQETNWTMQGTVKPKPTGQGHARMEEGDKVQLNAVQTLGVGAAWVIARGRAALIQIAPTSPVTLRKLPPMQEPGQPAPEEMAPNIWRRPLLALPAPAPTPATRLHDDTEYGKGGNEEQEPEENEQPEDTPEDTPEPELKGDKQAPSMQLTDSTEFGAASSPAQPQVQEAQREDAGGTIPPDDQAPADRGATTATVVSAPEVGAQSATADASAGAPCAEGTIVAGRDEEELHDD